MLCLFSPWCNIYLLQSSVCICNSFLNIVTHIHSRTVFSSEVKPSQTASSRCCFRQTVTLLSQTLGPLAHLCHPSVSLSCVLSNSVSAWYLLTVLALRSYLDPSWLAQFHGPYLDRMIYDACIKIRPRTAYTHDQLCFGLCSMKWK